MEHKTCNASVNTGRAEISEIVFCAESGKWVMKIVKDKGILFNRDQYPDAQPDDFAKAVIEILEKHFSVTFERKEPPYDKTGSFFYLVTSEELGWEIKCSQCDSNAKWVSKPNADAPALCENHFLYQNSQDFKFGVHNPEWKDGKVIN